MSIRANESKRAQGNVTTEMRLCIEEMYKISQNFVVIVVVLNQKSIKILLFFV